MARLLSNSTTLTVSGPQPDWVTNLTETGVWKELTGCPIFTTWMAANIAPSTGYRGSDPFGAIRDAFCTPAWDGVTKSAYLWGGGHSNGSCNALVKFDAVSLSYSIAIAPTPPSAYPPGFTAPNSPVAYPSGSNRGHFQTASTLVDPRDLPYAAPFAAPPASHTYSGIIAHNGYVQLYYGRTATADLNTRKWNCDNLNMIGPQLKAIQPNEGSEALGEGTQAVVDSVAGKVWLCVNPGSAGDNWRSHFVKVDAATNRVEALVDLPIRGPDYAAFVGRESMCIHGRRVYAFSGTGEPGRIFHGWFVEMDSSPLPVVATKFELSGDVPQIGTIAGSLQESVPCFSDGQSIYLWNYTTERDALYRIALLPQSGVGTGSDPFILQSTRIALRPSGGMPLPVSVYRLDYVPEWGVVMVLPAANSRWWALRVPG